MIIQNEGPIRYDVTKFGRNTCLQYTHTYLLMEQLNNEYSKSVDYKLTRRNLVNVDRYKVTLTRPLGIFHIDVWRIVISTWKYLKWINQQMLLDPVCENHAFPMTGKMRQSSSKICDNLQQTKNKVLFYEPANAKCLLGTVWAIDI